MQRALSQIWITSFKKLNPCSVVTTTRFRSVYIYSYYYFQTVVSKLLCNVCVCVCIAKGGNLGEVIAVNMRKGTVLGIADLAQILMQVSQGLKFIHAQGLVHLDIKPGAYSVLSLS